MPIRTRALFATAMVMLVAGCATTSTTSTSTDPSISVIRRVARGSTVAVVAFSDCQIVNQADCAGSGAKAGSIFVQTLSEKPNLHAISLPRPVGPTVKFTDEAAVAYAKAKGYRYVINGEVKDYFRTGQLALHPNRAAISVRVLATKDGQTLVTFSQQEDSKTHFTSPDAMLEDMAKQLATSIMVEPKRQHQGDFLLYKGNGSG
jgi:hypothetical protein